MTKYNMSENLYEELCSIKNLERAFAKARRGKTQKDYVIEFEKNLKENLLLLRNELILQAYKPESLKTFILRDPKTRKISKSAFRDRVIHHAICNLIEPIFDKIFIYDSFANRIGKGTTNAIKRFDYFKRKVSHNNTIKCFVLKADIKKYFETVNNKILFELISKRIHDARVLWLIKTILENYKTEVQDKGMPLGNLTSQFFANIYLNELDQFVKHKLRAEYYIRYVDDFVILHQSRKKLEEYRPKIEKFLKDKLDLQLHPDKSQILKLDKGIGFLGFRIFYYHKLVQKKNMRKFDKKMDKLSIAYNLGDVNRERIIERFEGWLAYSSRADTYKYRKRITSKFNKKFPANREVEIEVIKKHENFNKKVEDSNIGFSFHKTLYLLKKGLDVKQIAEERNLKEASIWAHIAHLVEHHQIRLKQVVPESKVKVILLNIRSPDDKLKEIKERINDNSITYDEINCVLANVRGKYKEKSITYFIDWYKRTNCLRKCYYSKPQREECKAKMQILAAKFPDIKFTKKTFLEFFNDQASICVLPDQEKRRFMSWKEFQTKIRKK